LLSATATGEKYHYGVDQMLQDWTGGSALFPVGLIAEQILSKDNAIECEMESQELDQV